MMHFKKIRSVTWLTSLSPAVSKALLIFTGCICFFAVQAGGAPLLTAQPTNITAFVGSPGVTFKTLAIQTSSLTYQWQLQTPISGSYAPIVGGTLSTFTTIPITDGTLNGNKYRCVLIDTSGTTKSAAATLSVFAAPTLTPSVTLTNGTIAANSGSNVNIHITGLNAGDTVRIERVLDLNGNGSADIGESIVQSFIVTDGTASSIAGVVNPNVPGDDDGVADGNITTHLSLLTSPESGQTAGNYLIRVKSPTGAFKPIQAPMMVTQPAYGQSVSGQVQAIGGAPLPYAFVILIVNSGNGSYFASTVADASGNYTLNAPVGSYTVIGGQLGYVATMDMAPSITLTSGMALLSQNPILTPATCTIAGQILDVSGTPSLKGVQVDFESNNNYFTITNSDANGNYITAALPDQWKSDISGFSLALSGYVSTQGKSSVVTTSGSVTALDLQYSPATAMICGTVKDNHGVGLSGIILDASLANVDSSDIAPTTDSNGNFTIPVTSGTWTVNLSSDYINANNWVGTSGSTETISNGQAITNVVFRVAAGTGTMSGIVLDSGSNPVTSTNVYASDTINGINYNATASTDSNGNYSFPIMSGTWNVGVSSNITFNNQTVTVTAPLTTVNFAPPPVTAHLTGTVTNNGEAVTGITIAAQLSGNDSNSSVFATTGGDGSFDLGITSNGTWSLYLPSDYADSNNLLGQVLLETVTSNQSIANIAYHIINGTRTISGNVLDSGSNPVVDVSVYASDTLNGIIYNATAYTDNNGNYSFPIVSGTWNVDVNSSIFFLQQSVPVNGSSVQVNFIPPTPFQLWQNAQFNSTQFSNPAISGLTALVPSGAGFTNLLAYALGLNPNLAKVINLPTSGQVTLSGTSYKTLQFTRNTSATDITYTVQSSPDLKSGWTTLCTFSGGVWTPSIVIETVNSGTVNNVQVQDPVSIKSVSKRFLRLSVTH